MQEYRFGQRDAPIGRNYHAYSTALCVQQLLFIGLMPEFADSTDVNFVGAIHIKSSAKQSARTTAAPTSIADSMKQFFLRSRQ
jgi:hypothetical protein